MSGWELRAGRDAGTRVSPAIDEEAPVRRKREDSDEELFFTPKSVRESYVVLLTAGIPSAEPFRWPTH